MLDVITVPFSHLVLRYRNIGVHRGRTWGFRDVFGFPTLRDLPFVELASKVKSAYEGSEVPAHEGWAAQREALRWLVDKGRDGIYRLDDGLIQVRRFPRVPVANGEEIPSLESTAPGEEPARYYLFDGHHRALALFVIGDREVRARVDAGEWTSRRRDRSEAASDAALAADVERDGDPG